MIRTGSETPSHSGQMNDDCTHTVPEIEVQQSLNGYALIQWLGIANLPYSEMLIALFEAVIS